MIIGIDIDEVIAALAPALLNWHNEKYNTNISFEQIHSYHFWEIWGGTKDETINKVLEFYQTEYFRNIEPVEGSQEGINVLSENNKLIAITSRPYSIYDETIAWVNRYFPNSFSDVEFSNHSVAQWNRSNINKEKSDICLERKIDVMIDDYIGYAEQCAKVCKKVLLFDLNGKYNWNKKDNLPENVTRVESWSEVVMEVGKFKYL